MNSDPPPPDNTHTHSQAGWVMAGFPFRTLTDILRVAVDIYS